MNKYVEILKKKFCGIFLFLKFGGKKMNSSKKLLKFDKGTKEEKKPA